MAYLGQRSLLKRTYSSILRCSTSTFRSISSNHEFRRALFLVNQVWPKYCHQIVTALGGLMKKVLYIAETDANGTVDCVWVKRRRSRGASVFNPQLHIFDPAEPAEYAGSKKTEILACWTSDTECIPGLPAGRVDQRLQLCRQRGSSEHERRAANDQWDL